MMHPLTPTPPDRSAHPSTAVEADLGDPKRVCGPAPEGPDTASVHRRRSRTTDEASRLDVWGEPGMLRAGGAVDHRTVAEFRDVLRRCDTQPEVYALDLSSVEFFSAAGVGALAEMGWTERPHAVVVVSPAIRRVLDACGLDFLLDRRDWLDTPT